ncbi:hypothetical protein, partial [Pelagibaculum spongiae]
LYSAGAKHITAWSLDPSATNPRISRCYLNQQGVDTLWFDETTRIGALHDAKSKSAILWAHHLELSSVNRIPGHVTHLLKAHAPGMMYYVQKNTDSAQLSYRNIARRVAKNTMSGKALNYIECAIVHPNEESIFILCRSLHRWFPLTSQRISYKCGIQSITNPLYLSQRGQIASRSPLFFLNNKQEIYLYLARDDGILLVFDLTKTTEETQAWRQSSDFRLAGKPPYLAIAAPSAKHLTYTSSAGLMRQEIAPGEQAHPFFDKNKATLDFNAPDISRYIISPCGTLLTLISPTGISTCNAVPIPALIKILSDMESSMKSSMKSSIKSSREAEPSSGCTLL